MKEMKVKILTKEDFEQFGTIIESPSTKPTISNKSLDFWGGAYRVRCGKTAD